MDREVEQKIISPQLVSHIETHLQESMKQKTSCTLEQFDEE